METGKFNVVIDAFWGSSGKGKLTTYLADKFATTYISSSNYPNAGHSAVFEDGTKFVSKAIPTAAILKRVKGMDIRCFISPGSGFNPDQFLKEWLQSGMPEIHVHGRASLVTNEHAERERSGTDSTMHIASTMQGSGAAIADKIMRKKNVQLTGNVPWREYALHNAVPELGMVEQATFAERVMVEDPMDFRDLTHGILKVGTTWLHEGSQGYALSIDHGSHYPACTSRNCSLQAAMDHMAVPPQLIGDVYLNLRTYPIRVGNVIDPDGTQRGYSGDFYSDCEELTWEQVAESSGMPPEEARALSERERTTVTKRIRRVSTFSYIGLKDSVRTNGATKLCLNFVQYLDWKDAGLRGGKKAFQKLSMKTRIMIDKIEQVAGVPVVLIGTGPLNEDMISLL
ncbi:MAG TPA: adenylosuccinate synthetase [Methylobacter sp.]|jgi:adenylosuccinate synthase